MDSLDMSILDLSGIEERRESLFKDVYYYNGMPVPRVSNLLKWCFNKEGLMNWAAKTNYDDYSMYIKAATTVGTFAHECIGDYLLGNEVDYSHIELDSYRDLTRRAVENFISWHNYFRGHQFHLRPLYIEEPVVTPWYGGTIDCIAEITFPNGYRENIIIDFKTSKSISTEYIMQTFA